jgi:hypothetical protein
VDPSADHAADIIYLVGLNLWQGRTNIRIQTMKYLWACIIHLVIVGAFIALMLCSTSWTKLWPDSKLACRPGRQPMVDGCDGEGNECWVDFINQ